MVFATGNDMQLDEVQPESGALPGDSIWSCFKLVDTEQ